MSKQERVSWVSLIVSVVLAWLYFSHVLRLPPDTGLRLHGGYIGNLVAVGVILGIAGEIAFRMLQSTRGQPVDDSGARDERDDLIELKVRRNGYAVLQAAVFLVLVQIALIEWFAPASWSTRVAGTVGEALFRGPLTAAIVWQLLLAATTLAGIVVYTSRIVYYRRGA